MPRLLALRLWTSLMVKLPADARMTLSAMMGTSVMALRCAAQVSASRAQTALTALSAKMMGTHVMASRYALQVRASRIRTPLCRPLGATGLSRLSCAPTTTLARQPGSSRTPPVLSSRRGATTALQIPCTLMKLKCARRPPENSPSLSLIPTAMASAAPMGVVHTR